MNSETQSGTISKSEFKYTASKLNWVYIVSNRADHILNSDYYARFTK